MTRASECIRGAQNAGAERRFVSYVCMQSGRKGACAALCCGIRVHTEGVSTGAPYANRANPYAGTSGSRRVRREIEQKAKRFSARVRKGMKA